MNVQYDYCNTYAGKKYLIKYLFTLKQYYSLTEEKFKGNISSWKYFVFELIKKSYKSFPKSNQSITKAYLILYIIEHWKFARNKFCI